MTNPCEVGLKCPYNRCNEEGDFLCVYPCGTLVPEDETFGSIEEVDCPLVEFDTPLEDFLFNYAEFNGKVMFVEGARLWRGERMTDIAKIVSKLQDLFWFGIPKNKRGYQRAIGPTEFLDKTHVMYVRADPEQESVESYIDDTIRVPKTVSISYNHPGSAMVAASYLKALCDAADDTIKLTVEDGFPVKAEFTVGGREIVAYIAPRIENS